MYVPKTTKYVNLLICQYHSCSTGIFNCELGFAIFPCYSTYSSSQMLTVQRLDILDFERFNVQVVQPQQRDCVVDIKSKAESFHEVFALLQCSRICRMLRGTQLHGPSLDVHPHLQFEVLHKGRVHLQPGSFQGCHAMRRDKDFSCFCYVWTINVLRRRKPWTSLLVYLRLCIPQRHIRRLSRFWRRTCSIDKEVIVICTGCQSLDKQR